MAKDTTSEVRDAFPGSTVSRREFETVHETPQQIKLAVGQGIEAEYVEMRHIHIDASETTDGKTVDFDQYEFQGEDGRYALNGSYQLTNAMKKVTPGSFVRITRLADIEIRGGTQHMNSYRVEVAK